jgi:phosphatidate cytidylyltransferase
MAYDEPPTNPPPRRSHGWSDPTADRDVRRGRHRARHADAAPDAYDGDPQHEDSYGFAYGDGVSAQPMYGPAPDGQPRRGGDDRPSLHAAQDVEADSATTGHSPVGPPTGEMPRAGRPPAGATGPTPVDPSWRIAPPASSPSSASSSLSPNSPRRSGSRPAIPPPPASLRALEGPTRPVPQLGGPRPDAPRPDGARPDNRRPETASPGGGRNGNRPGDAGGISSVNLGLDQFRTGGSPGDAQPAAEPPAPARGSATGADAPKVGRAGRNLPKAIGVGLLLVGIVLGSLFLWRPAFVAVLAVAACVGVWEMVHAFALPRPVTPSATATPPTSEPAESDPAVSDPAVSDPAVSGTTAPAPTAHRAEPPLVPLVGGCLVMAPLAYFGGVESLVLGLLVTILAVIVWRLSSGPAGFARDISASTLIATYVPFLLFFGILLARPHNGDLRVLCILAMVVLSDTGGYAAGVFFGKHPMAPTVSPKKSWEGLAGSLVATGVGAAFLVDYLLHQPYWQGAIIGVAVSAAAVLGDLAESMLKRDLGIKDMSNLLPGHGGVMDRLDSVVFAAPTAFVLLAVFAPVAT